MSSDQFTSQSIRQRRKKMADYNEASKYYEEKLENFPTMSRYNHFMGAISSEQGKIEEADRYYRTTLSVAPNDPLVKNDFAVHLVKNYKKREDDAIKELRKALIMNNDTPIVHKNLAAVLGSKGDYRKALEHANQAKFLTPNDSMNHRNIAKLEAMLGDNHTALKHNLESIEIDESNYVKTNIPPNTTAYRKAAVQIISRGGNKEEAHALMDKARQYENKTFQLSTSQRTYEIINKLRSRQADEFRQVQEKKKMDEAKKLQSKAEWEKLLQDMTK